jgi:peptidoglycan/LPS O-acetylase OafA/YrhL
MKAPLTTTESLALDAIRVAAAAVVAFAHLTQKYFSTGWTDLTVYARCSVAVFFVLSGFVIRYVTTRRAATLSHYLGDRASRIYSVALPALLLTLLTDTLARHHNPAFYSAWQADYTHPLFRIAANLAFCGQLWTHVLYPLSNNPYWSINYEVAYYLLYALWFYLAGATRIVSIAALCLIVGPRVLYLAPLWIFGCVLHDLYQSWTTNPTRHTALSTTLWLTPLAALIAFFAMVSSRLSHNHPWGPAPFVRISLSSSVRPPDYLFGLVSIPAFAILLYIARRFTLAPHTQLVRSVRFISEGTYPLYLLHFPLYVFIAAYLPYNHASAPQKLLIFLAVLTAGILAGHPANLLKKKLRNLSFPTLLQGAHR